MVYKISMAIFLVSISLNLLWSLPYTGLIAGISALVAAIALVMER